MGIDLFAAVFGHKLVQIYRSNQIVIVIEKRLGDALANSFKTSKMNHSIISVLEKEQNLLSS